ncbi:MAG: hypothetical protein LT071_07350 [Nocardioides sp.]|nr:hypothetical protein [Nocardioides sp.]
MTQNHDPRDVPVPQDQALATAVLEIESHVAEQGWDQPARLFALVDSSALAEHEPELAQEMGLDGTSTAYTAVEDDVPADRVLEDVLHSIAWPPTVIGCAAVVERLMLPPEAEAALPDEPAEADQYAREHPDRQEVRIVAGVTRSGAAYCALRMRSHDEEMAVLSGEDLVPGLTDLLHTTLENGEFDAANAEES